MKERKYRLIRLDPGLEKYRGDIDMRVRRLKQTKARLLGKDGDITRFANGSMYFGIHRTNEGWVYREWAPGADEMHLIGDFNFWNRTANPMTLISASGVWEITLNGKNALKPGQRVKVCVTKDGKSFDRIPLYIQRVVQDPNDASFSGVIWESGFEWTDSGYEAKLRGPLLIYEAHIGMAGEEGKISSFDEFRENVLPRIKRGGYNTLQLMAVMQHPYYASFGYQVSNFFAVSSWYGDPDGLKRLIDASHNIGIRVLLDIVHSHAADNAFDGIAMFDGTESQFFHEGERGRHPAWGTFLFNYGKDEVIHFLLSNIKFWLEEYHFDGFRFDGVTSMLYLDHGLGTAFDSYDKYYSLNTDIDAVVYLQLANQLIHALRPRAVTIAEDMSGMPGMCLPIASGGLGFDYRLQMGVPDYWIKALKSGSFNLFEMWHELTTRRPSEKVIGYCESHDQALVGDKTLMFRLADAEMYTNMADSRHSPVIDRAVALEKLIKFITLVLSGNGYLNFMGNEFGHPEWIDFPRVGNGWSYHYARRQWSLAENGFLKYRRLGYFDRDMLAFVKKHGILAKSPAQNLWIDKERGMTAFTKGDLVFIFNFGAEDGALFVPIDRAGSQYRLAFTSAKEKYAEKPAYDEKQIYTCKSVSGAAGFEFKLARFSAAVLEPVR